MTLEQILLSSGGSLVILLTLIQISPIKINPWSALKRPFQRLGKAIGRCINADVLDELSAIKTVQEAARKRLDEHIREDQENKVNECRTRILRFNNELLREIPHTKEEFHEVLADIDFYEAYCREHEEYKNGRAVHAIANIGRVYDERLQKHDFL